MLEDFTGFSYAICRYCELTNCFICVARDGLNIAFPYSCGHKEPLSQDDINKEFTEPDIMNKLRLALMAGICSCSLWFSPVVSAAFIIDDFNVNSTSTVIDSDIGGQVTGGSTIDGSNIVMGGAGWSRSLVADLTGGDQLQTTVCKNCLAGHVTMTANNSVGTGIFS